MPESNSEPVRAEQVDRLITHMRDEFNALLVDGLSPTPSARQRQARALLDAAERNSSRKEVRAAMRRAFRPH